MILKTATFIRSYTTVNSMESSSLLEFAFIGRSNVGKSSLINMLTNKKNLAKTSSKPGKTRLINSFLINDKWTLIDLPGYGYAKVSKKKRSLFSDMITDYLGTRKNLVTSFVLIDSRIPPQRIDIEFIDWCAEHNIPFAVVFTKTDKSKAKIISKNIEDFKASLHINGWENLPPVFYTSSEKKTGKNELLKYISELLQ